MMRNPARWVLVLAALAAVRVAVAKVPPRLPVHPQNGIHPESHAPAFRPARHTPGRWRMTAGHIRTCKRHYRSYNPRTNRYLGRSGVRHVCVL